MKITEFKKKPTLADVLRVGQTFCQSQVEKATMDKFVQDMAEIVFTGECNKNTPA